MFILYSQSINSASVCMYVVVCVCSCMCTRQSMHMCVRAKMSPTDHGLNKGLCFSEP